jgi:hypothetical protein
MTKRRQVLPLSAAFLVAAALLVAPAVAHAKIRVAVPDFKIEGDGTPALSLQLQDGFVLGLVRAGVQVLDPVDVGRKLEGTPELKGCESSPCLKNIGRLLSVRYVLRVKIDVSGNTYKMVARLFSTEGDAPAALPVSTKTRTCDVCTVAEAREYMLRLADAVRPDLEDPTPPLTAPSKAAPPPAPPSLLPPIAAAMGGLVSMAAGLALLVTLPDCHAATATSSTCSDNRLRSAIGGGLVGAGLVTSVVGTSVTISRFHAGPPTAGPTTTIALNLAF